MKKLTALVLAILMVCTAATTAFAAASGTINDATTPITKHFSPDLNNEVSPGTVWEFPLTADMFSWSDTAGSAKEPVTAQQLKNGSVTVKYTTRQEEIIENVSIATKAFGASDNKSTAYVKVEFVEEYTKVDPTDFTLQIYLAVRNSRKEATRVSLSGTFGNKEITADSRSSYAKLGPGVVLNATANNNDIELDLGDGVLIKTRLYKNTKYSGYADSKITEKDDAVVRKFPSIAYVVRITAVNIKPTGKCVSLSDYGNYYVYDANGTYMGTTKEELNYTTLYYLSSEQIDMTGAVSSSGTDNSSSSTDSSSSSSTASEPSGTPVTGASITNAAAKTQADAAVSAAKSSGSDTATVRFKDASSISTEGLRTISSTAVASSLKGKVVADTMNGTSVAGRLTINPASAASLSGDIQLGAYVDSSRVKSTKDKFEKYYRNNFAFVSLAHNGGYGMTVTVAAKVDLSKLNTNNLYFYSYDKSTNKYEQLSNTSYFVDTSGYLHFNTNKGYDIVVSDGALALK